jgi:hypothetical protein
MLNILVWTKEFQDSRVQIFQIFTIGTDSIAEYFWGLKHNIFSIWRDFLLGINIDTCRSTILSCVIVIILIPVDLLYYRFVI